MKRIPLIAVVAIALACRTATAPGGRSHPTLLVTNDALDSAVVTFTWSNSETQAATVRDSRFACVVYTVRADSGTFSITFPTPSGVNAGHGPVTLGPSAWFRVDSTADAYTLHNASLTGPDLAMLITETSGGSYGYKMGSAQACAP